MKYKNSETGRIRICITKFLLLIIFIGAAVFGCSTEEELGEISVLADFERLHAELSTQYAFTEWKQIDWDAKYQIYHPLIAAAEASNNRSEYYLLLRNYVHSIPDSHVRLVWSNDAGKDLYNEVRFQNIGGSYGLVLIGLDDGRIVVSVLSENGPAAQAGIEVGAEILEWNGLPIGAAMDDVPLLWANGGLATNEIRTYYRYLYIGRGPAGSEAAVTFLNPATPGQMTVRPAAVTTRLRAVDDDYRTIDLFYRFFHLAPPETFLEYRILPGGYGYVKIVAETDDTKTQFEEALRFFISNQTPGIIMDLRDNGGGYDQIAADILGHFYNERSHYEHIYRYNFNTERFEMDMTIDIVPRTPYFGGPVIAMVGPGCVSTGEGLAKYIQQMQRGEVVGFYASNGSFGMSGGEVNMQLGLTVRYADGQSRNENHIIQIDGDADGNGGVMPDTRVPLNMDILHAMVVENRDIELEFAIERMKNLLTRSFVK